MYMKKHTTIKRLCALVLALAMVLVTGLSLAVPARAAGNEPPFEITINSSDNVSTPSDGASAEDPLVTRFWAYQIFKGEISGTYTDSGGDNPPKANQLANVQWGDSIDSTKIANLLGALRGDTTPAKDVGVTYALMKAAGATYLKATAFDTDTIGYKAVYEKEDNWVNKKIGGTLTPEGEIALEAAFNAALNAASGYLTLGQLFTAALESVAEEKQAATVAKVLADFTPSTGNTALARAFTAIVADRIGNGNDYKYLKGADPYAKSEWTKGNETKKGHWTIGGLSSAGYYLIRDTYPEKDNKDKANSEYIVVVLGNSTVSPKVDIPTADKSIVGAENPDNAGSFEIGKEITFQVKGTLPENYDTAYKKYFYSFTDTMDAGLDYLGGGKTADVTIKTGEDRIGTKKENLKDILRVYVMVPNATGGALGEDGSKYDYYLVELDPDNSYTYDYTDSGYESYAGSGYWLNVTENTGTGGNQTKIEITIPDLKKLYGKKVTSIDPWSTAGSESELLNKYITSNSEIYVEYTAALNENAVVNNTNGNMNSVDLEYSNNPNWQGTGKPDTGTTETEKKTHVYDFGVAINKYNGSEGEYDENTNAMEDVGFALTKSGEWYPYFASDDATEAAGWISKTDVLAYLAHFGIDGDDAEDYLNGDEALPTGEDEGISPILAAGKYLASSSEEAPTAVTNMTAYALFKEVTVTGTPKHYAIAGWVPEVALKTVLEVITDTIADADWVKSIAGTKVVNYLGAGFESTGQYYLAIQTDDKGYLRIEGMGSVDTYQLVEVVTPDGYDTIDPISVKFTATYKDDGTLKSASKNVGGEGDKTIYDIENGTGWVEDYSELAITHAVPNYPAGFLPGTGGMGTTLFYIAGIVMLAGAVLFLIFSNVKKKRGQSAR